MNDLTVIIPIYNEEENIKNTLEKISSYCSENKCYAIFINDGSNDNTADILSKWDNCDFIKIIQHKVNKGYGGAIKTGISNCITDYCITFDADGQHRIEDIDKLYRYLKNTNCDMVIGRRNITSGLYKDFGKYIIRKIARMLMYFDVCDLNSGLKIYNRKVAIKYFNILPENMAYSDIIVLIFIYFRYKVNEIEIIVNKRIKGESKTNISSAVNTINEIINIVMLFNPHKIFLPLSLFVFIISSLWAIPFILAGKGLSTGSGIGIISSVLIFLMGIIAEQISRMRKENYNNIE